MGLIHIAGNAALDFVGTISERNHAHVEELRRPERLADWYVGAGLVDAAPSVTAADLAEAKLLREHLYEIVRAVADTTPLPDAALAALNEWVGRPHPSVIVDIDGHVHRSGSAAQCLAAVATAATDLFDRTDGALVRWCANPECTHPFLDRSRNHQRRWCDMASCGDRAKALAYRRRRAER